MGFAVKAGISQTDLDQKFKYVDTLTGVDSDLNDLYIQAGLGPLNGQTLPPKVLIQVTLLQVWRYFTSENIPSAPNHQIILSIDARTDDLAGESFSL